MISKFTRNTLSLFSVFLLSVFTTTAQTYPVYLTEAGTVTLQATLTTGQTAVWVETTGGTNTTLSSLADGSYTIPPNSAVGEHTYSVHLVSPAGCDGDPVVYKIFVLPSNDITLSATSALYCENAPVESAFSTITANVTPKATNVTSVGTLPVDVTYNYTWTATKGGVTTPIGALGSSTIQPDTRSSNFTFNTRTVGDYEIGVDINYVIKSPAIFRSGNNNTEVQSSTDKKSIVVSEKPTTPVITVM